MARLAAGLIFAAAAYAQNAVPPASVSGGQGETAFQGYYLGGAQQDLLHTTGMAFHFQEFVPNAGLLSGSFEGYGSQNRFESGEDYLELRGLPWGGHYWTFTGGDFRTPATLVDFPFNNIFNPDIEARGIKLQAVHGDTQYTLFWGQETITAGPRVTYRIEVPQTALGASAVRKVAPHWLVGARFLELSASPQSIAANPYLFPAGRTASMARTAAVQSLYTPVKRLKIYGEVSRPEGTGQREITSELIGATWEGQAVTLKANYSNQGVFYFPLAGYFAGDRRGPYGEAHYRPWKRLDLYASASQYRNNLEHNPALPELNSTNGSVGLSALLPGKFSFTGQYSAVRYSDATPGQSTVTSNNRQTSASLSRTLGRQTLQATWRELDLDMQPSPQRQRSTEIGDTYQFRHFSLGGAVRYQQVSGSQRLNSLFFRGLAQLNLGRVTAYANIEAGNDLANQTVFSTEAYRTSVVGASVRLPGRWDFQSEVFRNQLNFALNEESAFLLGNSQTLAGLSPAAAALAPFSQWSVYFRLSRQLRWGGGLPSEHMAGVAVPALVSLTGNIEGVVQQKTLAGNSLAAQIPVVLDSGRTAVSGPDGHYFFANVPEGAHEVGLAMDELPADFDPGELRKTHVTVLPNRVARADFSVLPLGWLEGRVEGPAGTALNNIVVRITPGRYTTTDNDGRFAFYNLREGDYELSVDRDSLPENAEITSQASAKAAVRAGAQAPAATFSFQIVQKIKPIRRVLDLK